MKPTTEQLAEDMAWDYAKKLHTALRASEKRLKERNGPDGDYLFWDNCLVPVVDTLKTIPLKQLLDVARAAQEFDAEYRWPKTTGREDRLAEALSTLKEKVKEL